MKQRLIRIALSIILMVLYAVSVQAQDNVRTIQGQVTDAGTGESLIGATVFINPEDSAGKGFEPQGTVTDYDGNYLLKIPVGVKSVIVPRFRRLEICCGCRVLNAYFFLHPDFLADQNLYL